MSEPERWTVPTSDEVAAREDAEAERQSGPLSWVRKLRLRAHVGHRRGVAKPPPIRPPSSDRPEAPGQDHGEAAASPGSAGSTGTEAPPFVSPVSAVSAPKDTSARPNPTREPAASISKPGARKLQPSPPKRVDAQAKKASSPAPSKPAKKATPAKATAPSKSTGAAPSKKKAASKKGDAGSGSGSPPTRRPVRISQRALDRRTGRSDKPAVAPSKGPARKIRYVAGPRGTVYGHCSNCEWQIVGSRDGVTAAWAMHVCGKVRADDGDSWRGEK